MGQRLARPVYFKAHYREQKHGSSVHHIGDSLQAIYRAY
jgi:hypothetical protein